MSYNHAVNQLEKLGLNITLDPEKVIALINEQDKNVSELTLSFREIENKITEIRQAKNIVESINKDEKQKNKYREHEL